MEVQHYFLSLIVLIVLLIVLLIRSDYKKYKLEIKYRTILSQKHSLETILNESRFVAMYETEKVKPTTVVLGHVNTYDCGWITETAWWFEDKKCWMNTGSQSERSNLHFTHWSPIPDYEKEFDKIDSNV